MKKFKKIYIEITNRCNLNCSFCTNDNRELKELLPNEFEIILKKIKNYTSTIYLHVKGEPLLHSNLEKILSLTKKYNMHVRITTNGTLLKQKYKILNNYNNIKQINISLHSENKLPNYFEDVFAISDLLSKKTTIVYRIWGLKDYALNTLSTKIVDKISKHYKLTLTEKEKLFKDKNIKIKDSIYLDKDLMFSWPDDEKHNLQTTGTCLGTRTHLAILVSGDVVPCCLDSKAVLRLGNIFQEDLENILNNSLFQKINQGFQKHILEFPLCRNCNFRFQKFK